MKIRKGDIVKIIAGKYRGKEGKVLRAIPKKNSVVVEGVNVFKKHAKPKKQGEKGEIVDITRPIHVSNVSLKEKHER
ncbi:MAG: 50S ribosomal protein L24 [Candidatus Omnitrophota bacterium]|nr:MAG: 50S ribosomal protein L24 [Candidatus Omnitrophota bacterium]